MKTPRLFPTTLLASCTVVLLLLSAASCTTDEELQRDDEKVTPDDTATAPAPQPAEGATDGDTAGAEAPAADDTAEAQPSKGKVNPASKKLADGERCASRDDCASGICEGEGCGDDALGVCMPRERMCTKDLRPYCGCDGKTFTSSGSCAMNRYANRGQCRRGDSEGAETGAGALGASCLSGRDCASGLCEGEGCGEDAPGVCVDHRRHCTRDYQPYCGCDGATFKASGSCPVRRYAHRGRCEEKQ